MIFEFDSKGWMCQMENSGRCFANVRQGVEKEWEIAVGSVAQREIVEKQPGMVDWGFVYCAVSLILQGMRECLTHTQEGGEPCSLMRSRSGFLLSRMVIWAVTAPLQIMFKGEHNCSIWRKPHLSSVRDECHRWNQEYHKANGCRNGWIRKSKGRVNAVVPGSWKQRLGLIGLRLRHRRVGLSRR